MTTVKSWCDLWRQDEDNEGFNTSDEEFERQLEEAAMMEEQEKVEKARKPKVKKGRGRNARKKTKKVNSSAVGETDADGYEVCEFDWQVCAWWLTGVCLPL